MEPGQQGYGQPNPNAPPQLAQFAFLIGNWTCEIRVKRPDGGFDTHTATLIGRYVLDGYAIEDVYRQWNEAGELIRFGATYRSYDARANSWVMKWQDALTSQWIELGPADLGGVQVGDTAITFQHRYPPDILVRLTFLDIAREGFTQEAGVSTDGGTTWELTQILEAHRVEE